MGFLLFSACKGPDIKDPFWDLKLSWNEAAMYKVLNDYTKKGVLENCVFSYDKKFYVKGKNFDARISGSLDRPEFEKDNLKSLNYSLLVEFRNGKPGKFNNDFYTYFKDRMRTSYGVEQEVYNDAGRIQLRWEIGKSTFVHSTIITEINHYFVDINKVN